jgi:hypothetical protein
MEYARLGVLRHTCAPLPAGARGALRADLVLTSTPDGGSAPSPCPLIHTEQKEYDHNEFLE